MDRRARGGWRGTAAALSLVVLAAGCGGSGERGDRTATHRRAPAAGAPAVRVGRPLPGSRVLDARAQGRAAPGTVTYCAQRSFTAFNAVHDGGPRRGRAVPAGACDVVYADDSWIASMADRGLIADVTPYAQKRRREFLGATLEATRFADRYWGIPRQADVALLYYRLTDTNPPRSWQELYRIAAAKRGLVYQGALTEDLSDTFLELAYAAGGGVLSADGRRSVLDSAPNRRALALMARGMARGATAKAVAAYDENASVRAFASGHETFLRNWSYARYALEAGHGRAANDFEAVQLPPFAPGGRRAAVLDGHALVVSSETREPQAAMALVASLTSLPSVVGAATHFAQPPALTVAYDDPDIPSLEDYEVLKSTIRVARPRPVSPSYRTIVGVIMLHVHRAIDGNARPADALRQASREIDAVLAKDRRDG